MHHYMPIYDLAVRHALETVADVSSTAANPALGNVKVVNGGVIWGPLQGPPSVKDANPFFLPWAMRGILEEEAVRRMMGGEVDAALQVDRATPLNFLPAGTRDDSTLYRTNAMGALVDALYSRFDVVIIVLPPITERPDAQALAAEAEVVAIAVRAGITSRGDLLDTVQTLRFVGPGLPLATVLIR